MTSAMIHVQVEDVPDIIEQVAARYVAAAARYGLEFVSDARVTYRRQIPTVCAASVPSQTRA